MFQRKRLERFEITLTGLGQSSDFSSDFEEFKTWRGLQGDCFN